MYYGNGEESEKTTQILRSIVLALVQNMVLNTAYSVRVFLIFKLLLLFRVQSLTQSF